MAQTIAVRRYFPLLDVARCIAISMVILHHVGYRFPELAPGVVGRFFWLVGWAGVDVFFVISGFLITDILVRSSGAGAIKAFFVNRAFRIVPLYAAALTFYVLVTGFRGTDRELSYIAWNALFLTGWAIPFVGVENMPYAITWSLSVEESAYILLALLAGMWRQRLAWAFLAAIAMSLLLRLLLVLTGTFGPHEVYYFPATRIDSIAFGGLVALGWIRAGGRRHAAAAAVAVAVVFAWLFAEGQFDFAVATLGYTVLPVVVAWLCAHLVLWTDVASAPLRLLMQIGRRSYFIYLFHVFTIGALSLPYFRTFCATIGFWGVFLLVLGVTTLLAECSWRFFESPLIRVGRSLAGRIHPAMPLRTPV